MANHKLGHWSLGSTHVYLIHVAELKVRKAELEPVAETEELKAGR
jgi:hypothetical protein